MCNLWGTLPFPQKENANKRYGKHGRKQNKAEAWLCTGLLVLLSYDTFGFLIKIAHIQDDIRL